MLVRRLIGLQEVERGGGQGVAAVLWNHDPDSLTSPKVRRSALREAIVAEKLAQASRAEHKRSSGGGAGGYSGAAAYAGGGGGHSARGRGGGGHYNNGGGGGGSGRGRGGGASGGPLPVLVGVALIRRLWAAAALPGPVFSFQTQWHNRCINHKSYMTPGWKECKKHRCEGMTPQRRQ